MKKTLLFIVIVLGILISGCTAPTSTPTPVYKTFNQNIVDSVIPVGAGQYVSYQLHRKQVYLAILRLLVGVEMI